jgi:hypothetical protein
MVDDRVVRLYVPCKQGESSVESLIDSRDDLPQHPVFVKVVMHSLRYKQMCVCLSTEKSFKPTSTPVE